MLFSWVVVFENVFLCFDLLEISSYKKWCCVMLSQSVMSILQLIFIYPMTWKNFKPKFYLLYPIRAHFTFSLYYSNCEGDCLIICLWGQCGCLITLNVVFCFYRPFVEAHTILMIKFNILKRHNTTIYKWLYLNEMFENTLLSWIKINNWGKMISRKATE